MSAVDDETLDPGKHFKNFKDENGTRVDLVMANLVYLVQSDKDVKWDLQQFLEYAEEMWRAVEKIEKVSKYQ